MKTTTKILLVAMTLFIVNSSNVLAKGNGGGTMFGVIAGVNMANIGGDGSSDNAMKIGFHVGALVNFGISDNFSIEPGVLYSAKGTESKAESSDKINLNYLEIPILAKYKLESGLNFFAGPYIGILMSATVDPGGTDIKDFVESTDVGLQFGIGYQLASGLGFNARYGLGFTSIDKAPAGGTAASNTNDVIGISVLYMFGSK